MAHEVHPSKLAIVAALLMPLAGAGANTIIEDPFTDGGISNGADPNDTSWSPSGGNSVTVAVDGTLGDGNALDFDTGGSTTFAQLNTIFDPFTLTRDRERLKVEFLFHLTNVQDAGDGIRFGLRNSSLGTQYHVRSDTGTNTGVDLAKNGTGFFGGGSQITMATEADSSLLNNTDRHVAMFTVQRTTGSRVDVTGRMDSHVIAAVDTGSLNLTFNQTGFQTGGTANQDYAFDNFRLTRWSNRFDDKFDSAGATDDNDANDPNDTQWFEAATTDITTTVVDDDGAGEIGSNNAMLVDNPSAFRRIVTNFKSFTLDGVGTAIEVGFDVRLPSVPASTGGGFRFGLFDSNGTRFTADGQGSPDDDDEGYHIQIGVGGGETLMVQEFDGTDNVFLGGATANQTIGTGSFNLSDTLAHFLVMRLTRTIDGLRMDFYADGVLVASDIDTTSPVFTFDELAFGTGNVTYDYILDNVYVDVTIPTPAALPAGLALLAFAGLRRRR